MASTDWLLPVLAIGGLSIGAIMFMNKKEDDSSSSYPMATDEDYERALRAARRVRAEELRKGVIDLDYEPTRRIPLVVGKDDDAYLITDEDFKRLDIGKQERKWLNSRRKIRDAQLERVVYGDDIARLGAVPVGSYFVNTVSPYGQGSANANELIRLPHASDLSRVNTRGNTLNLY